METEPIFMIGPETVGKVRIIVEGNTFEFNTSFVGGSKFIFDKEDHKLVVKFTRISSVLYYDEIFYSVSTYPYRRKAYDCGARNFGLFECFDSSYLERIRFNNSFTGGTFKEHRHFVCYDSNVLWHITAKGYEITKIDKGVE